MKKYIQPLLIVILLLSSLFLQGQISISSEDVLRRQKQALTEQRKFIEKSACPQREDVLKEYQANFDRLLEVLDIVTLVYHTPITIEKDRIKEQGEHFIKYQSSNLTNVIVKRHSSKISMAGIVSDNSSIPVGARLLTETFTLKDKEIEVLYRVWETQIALISLEATYTDKARVYVEFQNLPQAQLRVYNTSEYGTEHENLHVLFSNEIGEINLIKTTGYELYPERYTEMVTPNQGLIKHRYVIRCYDENGNQITPTQTGNDIELKPTTYLLWYTGTIGKYPIKMMLKRGFNKETNDERILEMAYGYDSHKKWISPENLWEPQDGIYGHEKNDDSPEWSVNFEYNQVLKGDWNNQNGTKLPITLTPMAKEFPTFTFKAEIEEELTPSGEVQSKIVRGITIYKNDKKIQELKNQDGSTLDYFELGYVDINYDGYLDLIINNNLYLYNTATQKFIINSEDHYYPYLTELGQYNLFDKSFTAQMNRTMLEYRAFNGKLMPYHSSSYYPNQDGDMVMLEERYVNGKWETIEKRIEKMDEDEDEEEYEEVDDDIDIASPKNYALTIDLTVSDGSLLFSPSFHNKTGQKLTFKQEAKLFTEVTDANNKTYRQFLYDVPLNGEVKDMLDDNYILCNGKNYFLENYNALIPFFPLNLSNGDYIFQLVVEHPLFGKVVSKNQTIHLPFQLKKDSTIEHFVGSINDKVNGSIYFKVNDKKVIGTFINAKTGKNINLKGNYVSGFFGADTVNFEEYEKDDELSGYIEGTINRLKGEHEGVYEGYWISPNKETRVPFKFKKQ